MADKETFFLGVDGGGTKTAAVLANASGTIIRTARKGSGNVAILDRGTVAQLIRSIITDLLERESVSQIGWATFAFAGAGRREEKEMVSALIRGAGVQRFTLMTDAEILHYSIFGDRAGILISSGTGSICLIRDPQGNYHQIGGRGFLLGDEGSGFFIGNQAIRTALHDAELGRPPSPLTRELLAFYGLEQPENLVTIVYSSVNPSNLIASCARLVCEAAESGDASALSIIEQAAMALVELAEQACRFFDSRSTAPIPLALAGGILTDVSIVTQKFKELAEQRGLHFTYLYPELEPAAAGVIYALRKAGETVSSNLIERLKKIDFST
ncbi:MAG: hypothetical protein GXO78_09590 [Calditrichaeota bacterium]|nr:hypothetical protein [Calditrichota bacterium]